MYVLSVEWVIKAYSNRSAIVVVVMRHILQTFHVQVRFRRVCDESTSRGNEFIVYFRKFSGISLGLKSNVVDGSRFPAFLSL